MAPKQHKEPFLFRMVRRGYDPEEVLDCFQSVIEIIRTLQARLMKERDVVYQEFLQAQAAMEEEKECVRRLEKELQEARQENRHLRVLYGLGQESASASGAVTAGVSPRLRAEQEST